MSLIEEQILFEDNHLIAINKAPSQIVQGDKTGDVTLPDLIKEYWRNKYQKPGNVFCGVIHRLDRPTSGVVIFARTGKGLERMNKQFRDKEPSKTYLALVEGAPKQKQGRLVDFLKKNEKQNKSYVVSAKDGKESVLNYKTLKTFDNYCLLEIKLETGRHHQIRCQISALGHPVKGDVKYGAKRGNSDGSICLHSATLSFIHPTNQIDMMITAPLPDNAHWISNEKK